MAWWGKLVGGYFGFVLGGPLGAMLGAYFGHRLDAGVGAAGSDSRTEKRERVQTAFFTATFAVMGRVAKADGRVSPDEIALARQVMQHFNLDSDQRKLAQSLFNQGKAAGFDLDPVLLQFRHECQRRATLIQSFLEIQIQVALADGRLAAQERAVLAHAAAVLGVSAADLERLINFIRGVDDSQRHQQSAHGQTVEDAYRILGVRADTPLPEIKKAYRRLLNRHHPDKLVSKGLPEQMLKDANQKTHQIRTAWRTIQRAHPSR